MTDTIIAVDPGLASTGVAVFRDGDLVAVETWRTATGDGFASAMDRARAQAERLKALLATEHPSAVVIEAYEDFGGGHKRQVRNRWTTPMVLALMAEASKGCRSCGSRRPRSCEIRRHGATTGRRVGAGSCRATSWRHIRTNTSARRSLMARGVSRNEGAGHRDDDMGLRLG